MLRHQDLIARMTLEEKIRLCSGASYWTTEAMPRHGIRSIFLSDGPHGLRKQVTERVDHLGANASLPATCFPTASAVASTWDLDLVRQMGEALGAEAVLQDVNVLLGPGVNMKRNPLCGRNFEYFSEDPYLAGKMAAAWIQGLQSQGVGASLKHFALNNQELYRMSTDVLVDERALREYYLPAFEIAVKEARPDATPAEKALLEEFETAKRESEATSLFLRTSGRFPLTGRGDVNTYAVFAETFFQLMSPKGRAGFIVPSGLATDNTTKDFFAFISSNGHLVSLYDFENRERLFPDVDSRVKFSLVTLGHGVQQAEFVCFVTSVDQLREDERRFVLTPRDFALINPNTRTCPVFRSKADAELTKKIYARIPVLVDESKGREGNPWGVQFATMFHMSNDSGLFRAYQQMLESGARLDGITWVDAEGNRWVPLYEAKMIHQYDHRWATYETDGTTVREVSLLEKQDPAVEALPRYWVPEREVEIRLKERGWSPGWLIGWRDIGRVTDERTLIATVLPRVGVGNKIPLICYAADTLAPANGALLLANLNSLVLDYVVRQKVGGTTLNFFYVKQFPVLPPSAYSSANVAFIVPRVLELVYTSSSLESLARTWGYDGPPFAWNALRRAVLKAELDAYYAFLYGLTRDELRYILDPSDGYGRGYPSETFRVLKTNEQRTYGEYRTQRLVLDAWDRLVRGGVILTGERRFSV
jgi:Beta-glucosidase-related glycosidases